MMLFEANGFFSFFPGLTVLVFFTGIAAMLFLPKKLLPLTGIFTVTAIGLLTSVLAIYGLRTGGFGLVIDGGPFFGSIPLRIDGLSSWFILVINFTAITGIIYGTGYLAVGPGIPGSLILHRILYITFHVSMLFVTMIQHFIGFLLVWEIMSLSSFLLVLHDSSNPRVLKAGINYLVQMHISVVLLSVAFIWVYVRTGSFDFMSIGTFFSKGPDIWLFFLFFSGFAIKSGFFGFHTWLPHAHPAAPSHISGVMSGVIVKLGIYGIFRIITFLKTDFVIIGEVVITLSVVTGIFGMLNSAVHRDFKKMLAYCTIENIGIIGLGTGLGLIGAGRGNGLLAFLGFGGALLHVLNHSLFKSLLFFSAGSVYSRTHTRDMDKLGGLIKTMPVTAFLYLIGALSIAGIPPFNGFISEFLIYCGLLDGIRSEGIATMTLMIVSIAGLSLIGGISLLAFTKSFGTIFLGSARQNLKYPVAEVGPLMLIPQFVIVAVILLIAFFPGNFLSVLSRVVPMNFPGIREHGVPDTTAYINTVRNISLASAVFLGLTGSLLLLRTFVGRRLPVVSSSTWGCGYGNPGPAMQYTGKSFSKPLGKIMNFILVEKKGYEEIEREDVFPEHRKHQSFYQDIFEQKFVNPMLLLISRITDAFQFIQNGRIQAYVIYGIVFMLVIFIGTVLNFFH